MWLPTGVATVFYKRTCIYHFTQISIKTRNSITVTQGNGEGMIIYVVAAAIIVIVKRIVKVVMQVSVVNNLNPNTCKPA